MKRCLLYVVFLFFLFPIPAVRAQVPVAKDPFHKVVFENEFVRVLDLVIHGTDTTSLHIHSAASVVVFLTKAPLVIQAPGEAPVVTKVNLGDVVYRPYDERPTTHKVWSADGSTMRCMVIEVRHAAIQQRDCKPIAASNAKALFQQKPVNVYDLKVSQADAFTLAPSSCPYFLLNVSGPMEASVSGGLQDLKAGGFVFIPAQSQATLRASRDSKSILIQLK